MSESEIDAWGIDVAKQLQKLYDLDCTRFVVIADESYFIPLIPHLPYMDTPLKGVGCGPAGYDQLDVYINNFNKK